ncbi:hypothetical protein MMC07_009337 [Pseudocyphellaria aurata]|nr:hypothetical protein [Pseudocyphellaria aurata]
MSKRSRPKWKSFSNHRWQKDYYVTYVCTEEGVIFQQRDNFVNEGRSNSPLFKRNNDDSIKRNRKIVDEEPSNSFLNKLPFEIVEQIIEQVEPASLPSLALVNRACRQLARSRQFASIVLNFEQCSSDLIQQLRAEYQEIQAHGTTLSPSLGVCVRYIKVISSYGRIQIRLDASGKGEIRPVLSGPPDFQLMQQILCSRRLLPHLQELDIDCLRGLPLSFFKNLTQSSLQHLSLNLVLDEDYTIKLSDTISTSWPLRTLVLAFIVSGVQREVSAIFLSTSILRLCASTLESFMWVDSRHLCPEAGQWMVAKTGLNPVPCFIRLRNLTLRNDNHRDYSMLDAFLHNESKRLGVRTHVGPEYANFFHTPGSIPSLRAFKFISGLTVQSLRFLRANTHLTTLSFDQPTRSVLLESQLLPLLINSFSRLTSLRLFWEEAVIPESALEMIGSLRSLQQIHMTAGSSHFHIVNINFHINHKAMRCHLPNLKALKKLAFGQDIYSNGVAGSPLRSYYQDMFMTQRDPADPEERRKVWEQRHLTRMLAEAREYGLLMPQLEWLFLGQLPVGFKDVPSTDEQARTVRVPVALATKRDPMGAVLADIFGDL